MISPSRSACSGLALSTVCGTPRLRELLGQQLGDLDGDRADEHRLALLVALLRSRARPRAHLPSLVLKIWSLRSARTIGRFVGISTTGSL